MTAPWGSDTSWGAPPARRDWRKLTWRLGLGVLVVGGQLAGWLGRFLWEWPDDWAAVSLVVGFVAFAFLLGEKSR